MSEYVYLVRTRDEARFAGQRLERSFLPQVLQELCFFVGVDNRVYVAIVLSDHAPSSLQQWARGILSECGERCDATLTLARLTEERQQFHEVYLDRGAGFLSDEG